MLKEKIYTYGKENGNAGVEARYIARSDTIYVKILGSNHWSDYLLNLFAWPRVRPVDDKRVKTHPVWTRWAWELAQHLEEETKGLGIVRWRVIGHSMGGAVGALLPLFVADVYSVHTVNSPRACNMSAVDYIEDKSFIYNHVDKGDIVRHLPLMYSKFPDESTYDGTRPFWKAHNNMWYGWKTWPC